MEDLNKKQFYPTEKDYADLEDNILEEDLFLPFTGEQIKRIMDGWIDTTPTSFDYKIPLYPSRFISPYEYLTSNCIYSLID